MPIHETDRFEAQAPDGRVFVVVARTTFVEMRDADGKTHVTKGGTEYWLDDGTDLSAVNGTDDEFIILPNGPVIRRKDKRQT